MSNLEKPAVDAFHSAVEPNALRALQIIHLSMGMGVVLFAFVVLLLYTTGDYVNAADRGILNILTTVNLAATVLVFSVGLRFHDSRLSRASIEKRVEGENLTARRCFEEIRVAHIVRLAILDAVAMFGTAITLLAVIQGVAEQSGLYWINLVGVVLFLLFLAGAFPTRERLLSIFETKVLA